MDLWAVRVKTSTRTPLLLRNSFREAPILCKLGRKANYSRRVEDWGSFEIRVSRRRRVSSSSSSVVVRAMAKKNQENSGMQYLSFFFLPSSLLFWSLHAIFVDFGFGFNYRFLWV